MNTVWFAARKRELKLSDATIGARLSLDRSVVNRVLAGKVGYKPRYTEALAELFEVSPAEILQQVGALPASIDPPASSNAVPVPMEGASLEEARDDLPVWGTALGSARQFDGEAIEQTTLNRGDVVQYAVRPVILNKKIKAYGLYVQGSSMHPALPDGEMLAVMPDAPLSAGDNVVVYLRPEDPELDDGETARAVLVKELVRRTSNYVDLRQYQPAKDFRVEMASVLRIDRVLTRREMMT